jgi:hypothetical protein
MLTKNSRIIVTLLILCLGLKMDLDAQNENHNPGKYQINIAENNNLINIIDYSFVHGAKIGFDYIISGKTKEKKNLKLTSKAWKSGAYLSFYRYKGNHTGFLFTGEIGRQRTGNSGFVTEANMILGYMLSYRELAKYDLLPNPVNTSHFIYGINFGIGWNLQKKLQIPFGVTILPRFYFQTPYKAKDILRIGTEFKISYYL